MSSASSAIFDQRFYLSEPWRCPSCRSRAYPALVLLACLIGLFAYDLLQAYRQWLEVFVEDLKDGVEITQDEIRHRALVRARLAGPVLLLCGGYRFGDGLATNTRYAKIMYSRAPGDGCGITCGVSFLSGATEGREPGILPIKYFGVGLKESLLNWC